MNDTKHPPRIFPPPHPTLPFDATHLAHTSNPETSKAAARACRELRGEHHEAILRVLSDHRGELLTACGIASVLLLRASLGEGCKLPVLDKHMVGRRLGELVRHGYVEIVDEEGETDTGRKARRYRIAGGSPQ